VEDDRDIQAGTARGRLRSGGRLAGGPFSGFAGARPGRAAHGFPHRPDVPRDEGESAR